MGSDTTLLRLGFKAKGIQDDGTLAFFKVTGHIAQAEEGECKHCKELIKLNMAYVVYNRRDFLHLSCAEVRGIIEPMPATAHLIFDRGNQRRQAVLAVRGGNG